MAGQIDVPSGLEAAISELEALMAGYSVCTTLENVGARALLYVITDRIVTTAVPTQRSEQLRRGITDIDPPFNYLVSQHCP